MFDLHIFSRFLRLVRSIRRSLLAFFVAIAMLLATFVIAPAYALSAGGSAGASADGKANTEQTEGAKADGAGGAKADGAGGAKADGAQKQGVQQSEPNKTESDKKNTDTSSNLKKNKESKPDSKQQSDNNKAGNKAGNKADNNAKSDDKTKSSDKTRKTVEKSAEKSAANKNGKDAKNKAAGSAKAANGTDRSAKKEPQLPEECRKAGIDKLAKCYVAEYKVNGKSYVSIENAGGSYTVKPVFHRVISINKKSGKLRIDEKKDVSSSVKSLIKSFSLERIVVDKKLLDLKEVTNNFVKVDSTSGAVTICPNNWLKKAYYYVYVKVDYNDNSSLTHSESFTEQSKGYEKYSQFYVKIKYNDSKNNVLSLKIYNHQKADGRTEVDETNGVKFTLNKDGKFNPSTIFIDSQSSGKFNPIYHRMICHKDSDSDYYLNSINDLTLSDSDVSGSAKSSTQKQWEHRLGNRTSGSVLNDFTSGELYENDGDSIGERSQSWITGTPKVGSEGKYTCKVFAVKDVELKRSIGGGPKETKYEYSTVSQEFNSRVEADKKSLFDKPEQNIVEDKWTNKADIKQGVDWAYKTITIQFGDKPEPPKIGKNDLTLNVYPFKNGDGSLPTALSSSNNDISAMLGMELKPFIDATSAADSANKITLRVLCSKGEKKDSGSQPVQPSGSTQPAQPSESPQDAKDLEYKTWSSNLADLGLSVPADDNQNTCHSNKEGEKTCKSSDPSKKVAARTDKEVSIKPSIKPTEVGDYQCVVFALKPDALTKFDDAISKATQSGSLTPTSISSALTSAKPTAFKENKDFATFAFNLHLVSNFTLPNTGGQSWNLQLGILAALLVNLLAAGFVVSQSERARKLIFGRRRGLCNYV